MLLKLKNMAFTNFINSVLLVFLLGYGVSGKLCNSGGYGWNTVYCSDDEFCCGLNNDKCCPNFPSSNVNESILGSLVGFAMVLLICCCPIYLCYRCCRRTTEPGFVYSPAPNTTGLTGTTVTVATSSQPSQMPNPSIVPYPQQLPYPVQQTPYPIQQALYPNQQPSYSTQQAPYPAQQTPYPVQQTPYPVEQTPYPTQNPSLEAKQPATNPYYGGPPPAYHTLQDNFQNASAPAP